MGGTCKVRWSRGMGGRQAAGLAYDNGAMVCREWWRLLTTMSMLRLMREVSGQAAAGCVQTQCIS